MGVPVLEAGLQLGKGVVDVIDQLVTDKDLAAKLKFQLASQQQEFLATLYTAEYTPNSIKIIYAIRDMLLPMMRPMASIGAGAFIAYAQVNNIELPMWVDAAMLALFPAWGASRHFNKQKSNDVEIERERTRQIVMQVGGKPDVEEHILDREVG